MFERHVIAVATATGAHLAPAEWRVVHTPVHSRHEASGQMDVVLIDGCGPYNGCGSSFHESFAISSGKRTFNDRMSRYSKDVLPCGGFFIEDLTFEIEGPQLEIGTSTAAISKDSFSASFQ
jgi:hypothetical protein